LSAHRGPGLAALRRAVVGQRAASRRLGRHAERHRGPLAIALGAVLALGLTAVLVVPGLATGDGLSAGRPSPGDVVAPRAISYPSRLLTDEAQRVAERSVTPVYGPRDRDVAERQRDRARDVLDYARLVVANPHATSDEKATELVVVPELVSLPVRQLDSLLAMDDGALARLTAEVPRLVRLQLRTAVTPPEVPLPPAEIMAAVDPAMDGALAEVVAHLASSFIVPNTRVDEVLTAAARQSARDAVEPRVVSYAAGQIIVRAGDPVRDEHLEAMAQLGLLHRPSGLRFAVAVATLMSVLTITAGAYLLRIEPGFWERTRALALGVCLIVSCALAARLALPGHTVLPYAFPAAAVAMTLGVVTRHEVGLAAGALVAVVIGWIGGGSLEMVVYVLVGSTVGVVVLDRVERLSVFLTAGLAVAAADLAVIAGFRLAESAIDPRGAAELAAMALGHGALSAGLTALLVLAAGPLFAVTTPVQLLELARPDHPVLRRLQLSAPGTYQHSILLGNLAEAAAAAVGADVLLVRVTAHYHDIGKTVRPQLFIENQLPGQNPHDALDPASSARLLIAHVTDGEQLARRHGLPQVIIDGILEHHGTMRTEYFYQQAAKESGQADLDDSAFRYPGPRPRSRETAILMLADASEAAVRAASPRSGLELEDVLERIFRQRIVSGQLDDCNLTLRDIQRVREVFVGVLQSIYHPRIRYPEGMEPQDAADLGTGGSG